MLPCTARDQDEAPIASLAAPRRLIQPEILVQQSEVQVAQLTHIGDCLGKLDQRVLLEHHYARVNAGVFDPAVVSAFALFFFTHKARMVNRPIRMPGNRIMVPRVAWPAASSSASPVRPLVCAAALSESI